MITNVNTTFFMRALLREESCCEFLFVSGTHQDAPFRMLGFGPAMNTYPTPPRHLFQERQESPELR